MIDFTKTNYGTGFCRKRSIIICFNIFDKFKNYLRLLRDKKYNLII